MYFMLKIHKYIYDTFSCEIQNLRGMRWFRAFYYRERERQVETVTTFLPPLLPGPGDVRMYKVKILMVGPCQSGKTMIANFLADATETVGGEYRPTAGVRILEFELGSVNVNNKNIKVVILTYYDPTSYYTVE